MPSDSIIISDRNTVHLQITPVACRIGVYSPYLPCHYFCQMTVLTALVFMLMVLPGLILGADDVGLEKFSNSFIAKWLEEQGQSTYRNIEQQQNFGPRGEVIQIPDDLINCEDATKHNIILPPLSSLLLNNNSAAVFQCINQLKKSSCTKQVFLWATPKSVDQHFVIPFLEYMADMIVHLIDDKHLSITTRKSGGLVSKKNYTYGMSQNTFTVKSGGKAAIKSEEPAVKPESLGTFKIDLNEEEMIARNALKLPYERTSENPAEGQIIYTPDADDDFDDEDPDEDLYI